MSNIHELWVVLFSRDHFDKDMYPFHVEQVRATIDHGERLAAGMDLNSSWHMIGLFRRQECAHAYTIDYAQRKGFLEKLLNMV